MAFEDAFFVVDRLILDPDERTEPLAWALFARIAEQIGNELPELLLRRVEVVVQASPLFHENLLSYVLSRVPLSELSPRWFSFLPDYHDGWWHEEASWPPDYRIIDRISIPWAHWALLFLNWQPQYLDLPMNSIPWLRHLILVALRNQETTFGEQDSVLHVAAALGMIQFLRDVVFPVEFWQDWPIPDSWRRHFEERQSALAEEQCRNFLEDTRGLPPEYEADWQPPRTNVEGRRPPEPLDPLPGHLVTELTEPAGIEPWMMLWNEDELEAYGSISLCTLRQRWKMLDEYENWTQGREPLCHVLIHERGGNYWRWYATSLGIIQESMTRAEARRQRQIQQDQTIRLIHGLLYLAFRPHRILRTLLQTLPTENQSALGQARDAYLERWQALDRERIWDRRQESVGVRVGGEPTKSYSLPQEYWPFTRPLAQRGEAIRNTNDGDGRLLFGAGQPSREGERSMRRLYQRVRSARFWLVGAASASWPWVHLATDYGYLATFPPTPLTLLGLWDREGAPNAINQHYSALLSRIRVILRPGGADSIGFIHAQTFDQWDWEDDGWRVYGTLSLAFMAIRATPPLLPHDVRELPFASVAEKSERKSNSFFMHLLHRQVPRGGNITDPAAFGPRPIPGNVVSREDLRHVLRQLFLFSHSMKDRANFSSLITPLTGSEFQNWYFRLLLRTGGDVSPSGPIGNPFSEFAVTSAMEQLSPELSTWARLLSTPENYNQRLGLAFSSMDLQRRRSLPLWHSIRHVATKMFTSPFLLFAQHFHPVEQSDAELPLGIFRGAQSLCSQGITLETAVRFRATATVAEWLFYYAEDPARRGMQSVVGPQEFVTYCYEYLSMANGKAPKFLDQLTRNELLDERLLNAGIRLSLWHRILELHDAIVTRSSTRIQLEMAARVALIASNDDVTQALAPGGVVSKQLASRLDQESRRKRARKEEHVRIVEDLPEDVQPIVESLHSKCHKLYALVRQHDEVRTVLEEQGAHFAAKIWMESDIPARIRLREEQLALLQNERRKLKETTIRLSEDQRRLNERAENIERVNQSREVGDTDDVDEEQHGEWILSEQEGDILNEQLRQFAKGLRLLVEELRNVLPLVSAEPLIREVFEDSVGARERYRTQLREQLLRTASFPLRVQIPNLPNVELVQGRIFDGGQTFIKELNFEQVEEESGVETDTQGIEEAERFLETMDEIERKGRYQPLPPELTDYEILPGHEEGEPVERFSQEMARVWAERYPQPEPTDYETLPEQEEGEPVDLQRYAWRGYESQGKSPQRKMWNSETHAWHPLFGTDLELLPSRIYDAKN